MLGILELDTIVCERLRRQDLAQCVRVSKKWHTAVIPHLWGDLTYLRNVSGAQKDAFRNMVHEDYLGHIQCLKFQEDDAMGHDIQAPSPSISALSKHGTWIQELPSVEDLEEILHPTPAGHDDLAFADELLLHFLKRCSPDVRIVCMSTFFDIGLDPHSLGRAIIDFTLPRLHHLCIRITLESPHPGPSKLMYLLDQCSVVLKKLELSINIKNSGGGDDWDGEEQTMDQDNNWTSLKELTLDSFTVSTDTREFWSWVFRRCGQVAKLEVREILGAAQVLAQDMLTHMPNLTEITLGSSSYCSHRDMNDKEVAELISGSRKGWRIMKVCSSADVKTMAVAALQKHSSTLESLVIEQGDGVSEGGLVQVLSTCANLHTLCNADMCSQLSAEEFGDKDPDTGLLRPWECEPTLKVLKLAILGIPRPDVWPKEVIE